MQIPGELSDSALSPTEAQTGLEGVPRPSQLIDLTEISRVLKPLLKNRTNLRLRTKLLLWLVLFSAGLTSPPLLFVRHSAPTHGPRENENEAPNPPPQIQTRHHHREKFL